MCRLRKAGAVRIVPCACALKFTVLTALTLWRLVVRQYKEFVAAVQFLSVLPVPGSALLFCTDRAEAELVIGSLYFPLVGLLMGLVLCLFSIFSGPYLPALVLAALLVVVNIWLTGGLHLDGLMDACDGLFGGRSRESKLEIMRDSRVGSFGVLGGVSIILLKFALLASMSLHQLSVVFLLVLPASRWAMVLAMYIFPSARPAGLGAAVRQVVTTRRLIVASLLVLLIALIVGHLIGLCVLGMAMLVTVALGLWVMRSLGGLTGDIYGMMAEVVDVVCLLLLTFFHFGI
jgi:adenosylcobinamide-GDP ribazoletransferase